MRFSSPIALLLFLTLPAFVWLGWPSGGEFRRRAFLSLILRVGIAISLILTMAGLELQHTSDNLAVVFLVDTSDSMSESAKDASFNYIQTALKSKRPSDQAAVILFGGEAVIERSMSSSLELIPFKSTPRSTRTNFSKAFQLGLATFPANAARRMILLTDGISTIGKAKSALQLASSSGVEVLAVPFPNTLEAEVMVSDVEIPPQLIQGEQYELKVKVQSTYDTTARLRIVSDNMILYEEFIHLKQGEQNLHFPLKAEQPGFINYLVQISPEIDQYYQNNEMASFSQVTGTPKILLIAPAEGDPVTLSEDIRPDEFSYLQNVLSASGFEIEVMQPDELPSQLHILNEYASVVLVDVPARDLTSNQMSMLKSYVHDLGRGLITVGGPTSYGVGGYFQTPLEEILPVEMEIKDQERRPLLTMVFIIDRSGSMGEISGSTTKLDLAKEATTRSIELLFPSDRVGVIAFDTEAQWVVPITDLTNPKTVISDVSTIQSSGGTDILAGLLAMANALPEDPAIIKHVILLTDGGANPSGIPDLVRDLYNQNEITLTTVGVGEDAAPFLEELANIGGGRYHFTQNPDSIPSIFTEETSLASKSYIIEEPFIPKRVNETSILSGITEIPPLHGYIGTTAKNTAQTILISNQGDPILAAWQFGLGKSIAFTSDASPRWAREWVAWNKFATFWAQALRSTINLQVEKVLEISVKEDGEKARLVINAQNNEGASLNGFELKANIIEPNGEVSQLELLQVATGKYETDFNPDQEGIYLIRVDGISSNGTESVTGVSGWVKSYSPEYRNIDKNTAESYLWITEAGGKITAGGPEEAFANTLQAPVSSQPVWTWLLGLAILLFPLDIAIRRLVFTDVKFSLNWTNLKNRYLLPLKASPTISHRSEHLSSLFQAKEKAGGRPKRFQISPHKSENFLKQPEPSGTQLGEKQPSQTKEPAHTFDKQIERGREIPSSTAARLLAKKRAQKDQKS